MIRLINIRSDYDNDFDNPSGIYSPYYFLKLELRVDSLGEIESVQDRIIKVLIEEKAK